MLAYEVSRIRSWDVALASWTVALTGGAITALDGGDGNDLFKGVIGWLPRRFAEWLQVWALRDQGVERDRRGCGSPATRHRSSGHSRSSTPTRRRSAG